MIEIRNLGKTFDSANGKIVALDGIDLTIRDGEIFGIIGLSGAGKSTLVRCINLLERPTEGTVTVDGMELTTLDRRALLRMRQSIGQSPIPPSSRADRSNASPSPVRLPPIPATFCATRRPVLLTPPPPRRSFSFCARSIGNSA